ncbi:prepilin peptidase, partial [Candidatus Dojkabacteria bacterium]|nr:prepilin peptidase [Candidatus Dojkabacteria bacterium]
MVTTYIGSILPILVLALGPVLASFLAAQVMRENGFTGAKGNRSVCDHCGYQLQPIDLIPLLSFVMLRGRCRKCGERIDPRVWLAEIIGLTLFGILAIGIDCFATTVSTDGTAVFGYALFGGIVLSCLLVLSIQDIFTFSIPLRFTQISAGIVILANILAVIVRLADPGALPWLHLGNLDNLLCGLAYAGFFQIIIWLTKQKGMGSGDVFIGLIIGLSLGWPATVT